MNSRNSWSKPQLEVLDISMTMKFNPGNPNYGGTEPGCQPSGGKPQKCNEDEFIS